MKRIQCLPRQWESSRRRLWVPRSVVAVIVCCLDSTRPRLDNSLQKPKTITARAQPLTPVPRPNVTQQASKESKTPNSKWTVGDESCRWCLFHGRGSKEPESQSVVVVGSRG